jgi:hypothetical protein
MANHTIQLNVKAQELLNDGYTKGSTDLNNYCTFNGQPPNSNLELFITNVKLGDEIEWTGQAENGNYQIEITNITRQSGKHLLDLKNTLNSNGPKKKCKIKSNKKYRKNNWEKYNLFFRIDGQDPEYEIDPIINIHGSR